MATRSGGKKEETLFGLTEKELDPTNPGAMAMGVMRSLSLDTMLKEALPGTTGRALFYKLADWYLDPAVDMLAGLNVPFITNNKDQAKAFAHTAVDVTITMSEGSINAWKAFREDAKIRAEINAELAPLHETGFGGIRASSLQPATANPNKMLEALEQNLQASANANFMKAGADLAIAGSQYAAKHLDKEARQEKIAKALEDNYSDKHKIKMTVDGKDVYTSAEITPDLQAKFKQDAEHLAKNGRDPFSVLYNAKDKIGLPKDFKYEFTDTEGNSYIRDAESIKNDYKINGNTLLENEIYDHKVLNTPGMTVLGTVFLGSKGKEYFEEIRDQKAGKVIAYDLVQCLNEALQKGELHKHGEVHLDKFLDAFKGHQFHTIPKNTKKVTVEQFIEEIFHQHIHDQGGEGISGRIEEDFKELCSSLSDAILGKDTEAMLTGASLHPLALIKLVGEGKLVDHKGLDMSSLNEAMSEVATVRSALPYEPKIDPAKYITELGMTHANVEDFIDDLEDNNPKAANYAAILMPKSVLSAYSGWINKEITEARVAAYPDALETTKLMVEDIASKSDEELKAAKLSKDEIALIRTAEKHVTAGEDKELMSMLSDKSTAGLSFALLCDQGYWQELAQGKPIGSLAHPDMIAQEAEVPAPAPQSLADKLVNALPFGKKAQENAVSSASQKDIDRIAEQTEHEALEQLAQEKSASFAEKHQKSAKSLDPENFKKDRLSPAAIIAERQAAVASASQEAVATR